MMLTRRSLLVGAGACASLWTAPRVTVARDFRLLDRLRPARLGQAVLAGCRLWLLNLPGLQANMGTWQNLMGPPHGTPTNFAAATTSTRGLSPATVRRGGYGEMRLNGTTTQGGVLFPTDALRIVGPLSILFWVYFTATPTGGERRLVASAEADGTPDHAYAVHTINDTTQVKLRWNGVDRLSSTSNLGTGVWQHVAATRSGTTGAWVARWYVAGRLDATSSTITQNAPLTAGTLTSIGCNPAGGFVLNGNMDDVMLFDRVLSGSEITMIYQDSLRGHPMLLRWVDVVVPAVSSSAARVRIRRQVW